MQILLFIHEDFFNFLLRISWDNKHDITYFNLSLDKWVVQEEKNEGDSSAEL